MGVTTEYLATQICTPLKTWICRYAVCAQSSFFHIFQNEKYTHFTGMWLHGYSSQQLHHCMTTWQRGYTATYLCSCIAMQPGFQEAFQSGQVFCTFVATSLYSHCLKKCFYTCQLFLSKMCEIFVFTEPEFSEDLLTASEDCQSFRQTSEDL